ncbi:hypothetical protein Tco_0452320 [Tanacetum coccineum]
MLVNVKAKSRKKMKCLKMQFKYARSLTCGASISWARSRLLGGTSTFSYLLTTCLNGLKQKRSPLTMPELFENIYNISLLPDLELPVLLLVIAVLIFATTNLQKSCLNMELLTVSPPRITHKQVGKLRFPIMVLKLIFESCRIAPDFEDSRARGFVLCSLELQSLA